eukprot:TRINITY_DN28588_c0_g1_i1.p1 TRINITY_DN28588_c0_g1~~TRINITY_DN28588_c0_g1_i1.p1  ORF type:complete len:450 (+),score=90.93 TRINITY_DN28588_c0_g1_i1:81-1352(+)
MGNSNTSTLPFAGAPTTATPAIAALGGAAGDGRRWEADYGDRTWDLVLSLHAVHNVQHSPSETYYGTASSSESAPAEERVVVTSTQPAFLQVRSENATILIRVYLHERNAGGDRLIGLLRLPLAEAVRHCGPAIFETWFRLEEPPPNNGPVLPLERDRAREAFRHALFDVSLQVRAPRVCLTLHRASVDPSTWGENEASKAAYFAPLQASHNQLTEMTAVYFDQTEQSGSDLNRSTRGLGALRNDADNSLQSVDAEQVRAGFVGGGLRAREERTANLEDELARVTGDANKKIEAGNESILRLKAEVKQLGDANAVLRGELDGAKRRAQDARQRVVELRSRVAQAKKPPEPSPELSKLRQEVLVLTRQKDALMGMVQDVYGNAKALPRSASKESAAAPGGVEGSQRPAADGMLLPDPRELFGVP